MFRRIKTHREQQAEKKERFERLREEVRQQVASETRERINTNPVPTEREIALGTFVDMLEPQVREAVLHMHTKGYSVSYRGFAPRDSERQIISGMFTLDPDTKTELRGLGVQIDEVFPENTRRSSYIKMGFRPQEPDLAKIKEKWDLVADILPDRKRSAIPTPTNDAVEFRKRFAPHSPYLEEWQQRILGITIWEAKLANYVLNKLYKKPKTPAWILVTTLLTVT